MLSHVRLSSVCLGVSVYSDDVKFRHRLSSAVVFVNTSGSRCRAAAARIRQRSEEMLPFADWLIQRWRLSEKISNFVSFNIYCSAQLNENVITFCFTVYVTSLHVVNKQKVRLLPEVVKPSTAVYDTVFECDLSCQKSCTCVEAVLRR